MKKNLLTFMFLLVCGYVSAQTADEKVVNKIVDDYGKAIIAKDSVALGKLLTADCTMNDPSSQTFDKKAIMDVFCNKTYDVSKFSVVKRAFSQKGETLQSVVTSDIGVVVNNGGAQDMSGGYINTFTFLKQNGQWLISNITITAN